MMNKRNSERKRLIIVDVVPSVALNENLLTYASFNVEESGYYHMDTQISLYCEANSTANFIQYGICDKLHVEFGKTFNSRIINALVDENQIIADNLSTIKYLDKDVDYVAWCNFSSLNGSWTYKQEYSHLQLLKL